MAEWIDYPLKAKLYSARAEAMLRYIIDMLRGRGACKPEKCKVRRQTDGELMLIVRQGFFNERQRFFNQNGYQYLWKEEDTFEGTYLKTFKEDLWNYIKQTKATKLLYYDKEFSAKEVFCFVRLLEGSRAEEVEKGCPTVDVQGIIGTPYSPLKVAALAVIQSEIDKEDKQIHHEIEEIDAQLNAEIAALKAKYEKIKKKATADHDSRRSVLVEKMKKVREDR